MDFGRALILLGILTVIIGILYSIGLRLPKLPGDILIQRDNFTFYFPLATSIIASIIITILINLFLRR